MIGNLVQAVGSEHSLIPTWFYGRLFVLLAIGASCIQGFGIALLLRDSNLGGAEPHTFDPSSGQVIVVVGCLIQLVSLGTELTLFCHFGFGAWISHSQLDLTSVHPLHRDSHVELAFPLRIMLSRLPAVMLAFFLRGVYQLTRFATGFDGTVATNEIAFVVGDGVLVALALASLVLLHPSLWLSEPREDDTTGLEKSFWVKEDPSATKRLVASSAVAPAKQVAVPLNAYHRPGSMSSEASTVFGPEIVAPESQRGETRLVPLVLSGPSFSTGIPSSF